MREKGETRSFETKLGEEKGKKNRTDSVNRWSSHAHLSLALKERGLDEPSRERERERERVLLEVVLMCVVARGCLAF